MTLLIQTGQALIDTRLLVAAVPKAAPRVDTPVNGKAPAFTGEHNDWPECSFQFGTCMGPANPKSTEALRWAAMDENSIAAGAVRAQEFEEHNPQLYLAFALLCAGSALDPRSITHSMHCEV